MPRENKAEKSRVYFSCQAQYLVEIGMRFFVAGVEFRAILGYSRIAKFCIFFIQNIFPRWDESGF